MATDYELKNALPNKLLNEDGTITDLLGNPVTNATDVYNSKRALPNKWLNSDGSYSTLTEIISGAIDTELFIVVEELPATGEPNKIYLLVDGDKLIEYHWTGTKWDPMGMVEFDISKYSTTEQMNAAIAAALNSAKAYADNKLAEAKSYTDMELEDCVKDTDYATASKGGVIKTGYGLNVRSGQGDVIAETFTYNIYQDKANGNFISKGTLENVITGKQLINQTDLDTAIQTSITQVLGGSY